MTRVYKQAPAMLQGTDLRMAACGLADQMAPGDLRRAAALAKAPLMRVALLRTEALDGLALTAARNAAYRQAQKGKRAC